MAIRQYVIPHKGPSYLTGPKAGPYFCQTCKTATKLCSNPASHQGTVIPTSFSGAAFEGLRAPVPTEEEHEVTADTDAFSAILTDEPVHLIPQNRGGLGDPAPLTSVITLRRNGDLITVGALFDTGSENSYFNPSMMERFGVTRQKKMVFVGDAFQQLRRP